MSYANLPYSPLSLAVWRDKYQFGNETSPEDTLRRVATAFEVDGVNFLEETITAHKFVPGGRILAGLNTTRKVTFSQCYVIPSPEDSMEGILHTLGEYALTLKAGGGVGFNCSTLRPKGTDIATNPGAVASGPLSFAQIFDAASKTIVAGGCLVGDTLLTTQTGWVSIKDVVTKKMAVKVRTHAGFRRITDWFDNGEAETIKVTFEGGQAITCTQAHKFHTLNEKGELVKKPIGEFSVGDTCLFSTLATSPLSETPDDISYLLGYYWANGYDQYRTLKSSGGLELHSCTITMPNTDYGLKIREQIQATLNDYAVDYRIRSGCGDCTIIYLPKKSAAWLTSWHGAKGKSAAIEFPHGVSVVPFIAGFFDGDGSWRSTKAGAKFSSTSKGMLATIQLYLMDLGVPSKLSVDYRTNGWRDLWTLSILGQEWQGRFTAIFGDWIHKLGPITVQGKSFNYPPEALYFESPVHKDWAGSIVEGQRIGHATFKRLWPDSELLAFGGIRIIDIEPAGRQHVYDIEVEGTHSYTVGGISVSNSRRGASMLVMDVSHPDIEEFIAIKQTPGVLTQFNISVAITDEFMKAVAAGEGWDLTFNGKWVRTVPARDLWGKIMRATYEYAEPGVLFIDRANQLDPLGSIDKINATNPCLVGDTWILTSNGPKQVKELVGVPFASVVGDKIAPSTDIGFFSSGVKPVVRLTTKEGYNLTLTADHKLVTATRGKIAVNELEEGEQILLAATPSSFEWAGPGTREEGYLLGLLVGDGHIKNDGKAILGAWRERDKDINTDPVAMRALAAALTLPHRAGFTGWMQARPGEYRLSLVALQTLAERFGITSETKTITPETEKASSAFYAGFLGGLFDADGTVGWGDKSRITIRLCQSDLSLLEACQRMLLRLGIASRIYKNRRKAGERLLPNSSREPALYSCKASHELSISKENILVFMARIGFTKQDKRERLALAVESRKVAFRPEPFTAQVDTVTPVGEEEVYDCQIYNLHLVDANGITTTNCGEQFLADYASCNLGAINLVPFVPFGDGQLEDLRVTTADAVDFLDSVLDVNYYPLEAQRERAMFDRRIGIGIMGLGSALAIMGIDYGSPEAVTLLETILRDMQFAAQVQTVHLAKTKGPCPAYIKHKDDYIQRRQQFLTKGQDPSKALQTLLTNMEAHGVRNSHLLTIAPTGNTSIFAKNVSGGIEPVFAPKHNRTVLQPDGTKQTFEVVDASLELGATEEYFSRNKATALSVDAHLAMLATAQKFIDNSVSKTINVAADCDFESFKEVYTKAYSLGCKGCTTYRPSEVRGAVLTEPVKPAEIKPAHQPAITSRPRVLDGKTYKIRWDGAAYYVTINDLTPGRPFEFFINSKNKEDLPWITGLTRLASAILRKEGNPNLLITEFKEVYGVGGEWEGGTFYSTIINKLGAILEEHVGVKIEIPSYSKCPKCGSHEIVHSEGCISCTACGYSKCS